MRIIFDSFSDLTDLELEIEGKIWTWTVVNKDRTELKFSGFEKEDFDME